MTARVIQLPAHADRCDQVANDLRAENCVYRGLLMAAAEVLKETLPAVMVARDVLREQLIEQTLSGDAVTLQMASARMHANKRTRRRVLAMMQELSDMASRQRGY